MIHRLFLFAAALFATNAHAVLLQADLSKSPILSMAAGYDNGSPENSYSEQPLTNGNTPVQTDILFTFSGANGEGIWSTNIGNGNSFYFDIIGGDAYYTQTAAGTGGIQLNSAITVNLVAEAGESNGDSVTLNWSAAVSGYYAPNTTASTMIDFGPKVLFSHSVSNAASANTGFSNSDSGAIQGYRIGESFTLSLFLLATATDAQSVGFHDTGTLFSMTAVPVPEPGSISLLVAATLGAVILARPRRRPRRADDSEPEVS